MHYKIKLKKNVMLHHTQIAGGRTTAHTATATATHYYYSLFSTTMKDGDHQNLTNVISH